MICNSFQDGVNWFQNRFILNNELLDPVLFFRSAVRTFDVINVTRLADVL